MSLGAVAAPESGDQDARRQAVVAGPVVVHVGGDPYVGELVRDRHANAPESGNALAAHDIERAMFGIYFGFDLHSGSHVSGGHSHHLRAINTHGGIQQAVEAGALASGLMYECVRSEVPFSLLDRFTTMGCYQTRD